MPTIKSKYNIEQFEKVLQKRAHELAIDAVTNLNTNKESVNIRINGSQLTHIETDDYTLRFYTGHMSYSVHLGGRYKHGWGFDVEEKNYLTSNHCTKISFAAQDDEHKQIEERITAFIDRLMAEASMEPIPRFKLNKVQGTQYSLNLEG